MDFIEGLPLSDGFFVIMVVVDLFSKSSHFMALKHPFTVITVDEIFFDHVLKLHGMPISIILEDV